MKSKTIYKPDFLTVENLEWLHDYLQDMVRQKKYELEHCEWENIGVKSAQLKGEIFGLNHAQCALNLIFHIHYDYSQDDENE